MVPEFSRGAHLPMEAEAFEILCVGNHRTVRRPYSVEEYGTERAGRPGLLLRQPTPAFGHHGFEYFDNRRTDGQICPWAFLHIQHPHFNGVAVKSGNGAA